MNRINQFIICINGTDFKSYLIIDWDSCCYRKNLPLEVILIYIVIIILMRKTNSA